MGNTGGSSFIGLKILVCTLAAVGAYGQATTLQFCNDCLPSPPDRLVRDVLGNPLVGTNYVAQLYLGASPDTLTATTAQPARFRAVGAPMPGTWLSRTINLTGFGPGAIYLQVRVWDTSVAPTYDQATTAVSGQYGKSEVFVYDPCSIPQTPDCDKMLGFRGFTLSANLPANYLVIRENGDRVDLLYSGTHTIEAAPGIRGPWTTVHSSTAPFTDPASATNNVRFYRMRDEPGPTYSVNAVGYYRLSLCNGFSMIANQLNARGGNSISNLFKSPPEGTRVCKYNPATGGFILAQFIDGEWEGSDPDLSLNPGEGAFFWSPATAHRFIGDVVLAMSIPLGTGFSLISNPLPEAGPVDLLPPDGMGLPIRDGTRIYQWNCATQGFIPSEFADGLWNPEGSTVGPTVAIGEAFYFFNPGPAMAWTRSFTVGP